METPPKKDTKKPTQDKKIETSVYEKLARPFPKEAIERSSGAKTGKGYDTTGYGYQYIVNRFNEVLGIENWTYTHEIVHEAVGQTAKGKSMYDFTVKVNIFLFGLIENRDIKRSCVGGHSSLSHADGLKGAITNAFKKTAAFYGVGKEVYEGTVDDDNAPKTDEEQDVTYDRSNTQAEPDKPKNPLSQPQMRKIFAQLKELDSLEEGTRDKKWFEAWLEKPIEYLSKHEASLAIESMEHKLVEFDSPRAQTSKKEEKTIHYPTAEEEGINVDDINFDPK